MLMWLAITALIVAGVALLIVEVIFIPGTTIVGILGLLFILAGILVGYREFGSTTGNYILLGTSIVAVGAIYVSFRKGAWKKFSLNTSIDSKVNEGMVSELVAGVEGITVSALRPMGTAEFNGKIVEVKTNGDYLAPGTPIKIVLIQSNDILVEPSI